MVVYFERGTPVQPPGVPDPIKVMSPCNQIHSAGSDYRGTSLKRNSHPVGPYSRTMPRGSCGGPADVWGGAISYERGTL